MRALLSLCNQQRGPEQGPLLFDFHTKSGTWIAVGTDRDIMGTRGIVLHEGVAYVLYTVGWWETHLATYHTGGNGFELVDDRILPEVKDPHSLCVYRGNLLIASTGTDEILAYAITGEVPGKFGGAFWRAGDSKQDAHHVNSVATDGTRVLVSAFGLRAGEYWSSAEDGFVYDITAAQYLAEDLRHPHSVRIAGETVYFTESARQTVRGVPGSAVIIGGYTRGFDVVSDNVVLVGSNAARRVSRSQGVVTNSNNIENTEGQTVGKCSIARVALQATPAREYFDISRYGKEIYDICVLK